MPNVDRLKQVRERIAGACAKAKRAISEVTLVAVTKNADPQQIEAFVQAGHRDFGESKVQQLLQRTAQLEEWLKQGTAGDGPGLPDAKEIHWHMIGHLQRNKVKPVLQLCKYVHSVDSLRLAEEIQLAAMRLDKPVEIFLEVNTSGESSKFGVAVGAATHLAEQIDTMEEVKLVGLMTMAPATGDAEEARPHFARLREIYEEVRFRKIGGTHFRHLSMGMSSDYWVAVEEGATMVRVGSALFGPAAL